METLIEVLKQLAVAVGVVAPVFKFLPKWLGKTVNFGERHDRLQRFFTEGGADLPPLQMEAAIASALGHDKLSAKDIRFLIRLREPSRFLRRYLEVRQYLRPNDDGTRIELASTAASIFLRNVVRTLSAVFYVAFAGSAGWLLLFGAPSLIAQSSWLRAAGALGLTVPFAFAAWLSLVEARRITWALELHKHQDAA
ncbi:MAG: hypothetical protein KGM91_17615 [Burkholderiales bacterium]|nr:hypothetical protein [Burkholderiales bacterium]